MRLVWFQYNLSNNMVCHPRSQRGYHHSLTSHQFQMILIKSTGFFITGDAVMMVEVDNEVTALETGCKPRNGRSNAMMRK